MKKKNDSFECDLNLRYIYITHIIYNANSNIYIYIFKFKFKYIYIYIMVFDHLMKNFIAFWVYDFQGENSFNTFIPRIRRQVITQPPGISI